MNFKIKKNWKKKYIALETKSKAPKILRLGATHFKPCLRAGLGNIKLPQQLNRISENKGTKFLQIICWCGVALNQVPGKIFKIIYYFNLYMPIDDLGSKKYLLKDKLTRSLEDSLLDLRFPRWNYCKIYPCRLKSRKISSIIYYIFCNSWGNILTICNLKN